VYSALPHGDFSGWCICGTHLNREIGKRFPLFQVPASANAFAHEVEVDGVVIQAMRGPDHLPCVPGLRGTRGTIGYTFFEMDALARECAGNLSAYAGVLTGSTWCTEALRFSGVSATTAIQGVDTEVFCPNVTRPEDSKFVVFSGGCFQIRKAQDAVVAMMKVFMEHHSDVNLFAAWGNPYAHEWGKQSLIGSRLIDYDGESLTEMAARNGLPMDRVTILPVLPNSRMAEIYRGSDLGLFPNRCEGGTNLVMMEFMACGKPVLGTFDTGHADVLNEQNALRIATQPMEVTHKGTLLANWADPEVEHGIEQLEWAYQHREELGILARAGMTDMRELTWARCANHFTRLIEEI